MASGMVASPGAHGDSPEFANGRDDRIDAVPVNAPRVGVRREDGLHLDRRRVSLHHPRDERPRVRLERPSLARREAERVSGALSGGYQLLDSRLALVPVEAEACHEVVRGRDECQWGNGCLEVHEDGVVTRLQKLEAGDGGAPARRRPDRQVVAPDDGVRVEVVGAEAALEDDADCLDWLLQRLGEPLPDPQVALNPSCGDALQFEVPARLQGHTQLGLGREVDANHEVPAYAPNGFGAKHVLESREASRRVGAQGRAGLEGDTRDLELVHLGQLALGERDHHAEHLVDVRDGEFHRAGGFQGRPDVSACGLNDVAKSHLGIAQYGDRHARADHDTEARRRSGDKQREAPCE
mmetsp:Transcript_92160/g.256777  ORF Transcript_92160/g.256777 Transcript_92160/m.256777 type:complete len:352 (-) Transcript_92160:793-1848(-)